MKKLIVLLFLVSIPALIFSGFTNYTPSMLGITTGIISSVDYENDSSFWAATVGGGAIRFQGEQWEIYRMSTSPINDDNVYVICVCTDVNGNIWMGTERGIAVFKDDTTWLWYDTTQGLPSNVVTAITSDNLGQKWVATQGGIASFNGSLFTKIYASTNEIDEFYSLLADGNGNLWVGSNGGLLKYNGSQWSVFDTSAGLPDLTIYDMTLDQNGVLWLATGDGLATFNGTTVTGVINNPRTNATNIFYAIERDGAGFFWLGTLADGLLRYDGSQFISYLETGGLVNNTVKSISINSKHERIVGTANGLSRFINESPLITSVADSYVVEGEVYTYPLTVSDGDQETHFTFLLTQAPAGMSIGSTSGLIQWSPGPSDVGTHSVTVKVTDPYGGQDLQSYNLLVDQAVQLKMERTSSPSLSRNFPNPFQHATMIRWSVPVKTTGRVEIFDQQGKILQVLAEGSMEAGLHEHYWSGGRSASLSSGIYFYRLSTPQITIIQSMHFLK